MSCIWPVTENNRHCEYCTYEECRRLPKAEMVAKGYADTLSAIIGRDVLEPTRESVVVWARYMIAYKMRKDGYSTTAIGDCLGLHHATVMHGSQRVKDMLEFPGMFRQEFSIWKKFVNSQK